MTLICCLVEGLKSACAGFQDDRKGRGGNIAMADFGLSAFAMFFMQSGSFLHFQRIIEDENRRSNCQTLFAIGRIPTDASIRSHLDGADPALLRPCFEALEQLMGEPAVAQAFRRLGGRTLIALDGTEYFCSQKLGCPHCLTRKRANGEIEAYHLMLAASLVAPGHSKVIALFPEFVAPQDGAEKQDCERNAAKRWHGKHGARLKGLKPVYLGDDLFACHPFVKLLKDNGDDFIFTAKEASHKTLYEFLSGAELSRHAIKQRRAAKTETLRYRWLEDAPLRDGKDAIAVTWIGFEIVDAKGKVTYSTAFVTSLAVSKDSVADIVAAARARWKIENGSFNVMKNHGYELEHNFGHGKQYLAKTFAALNLLAFAWHTLLDLVEPPWKAARDKIAIRTGFFAEMNTLTRFAVFPNWQLLLESLTTGKIPPQLLHPPETS